MEKVINMKILFVLDSMSDWCGANVNIAIKETAQTNWL